MFWLSVCYYVVFFPCDIGGTFFETVPQQSAPKSSSIRDTLSKCTPDDARGNGGVVEWAPEMCRSRALRDTKETQQKQLVHRHHYHCLSPADPLASLLTKSREFGMRDHLLHESSHAEQRFYERCFAHVIKKIRAPFGGRLHNSHHRHNAQERGDA
jgi:hypothetical protein